MPGEYRFLTTWCSRPTRERVWDAIYDSERWPEWWRGVLEAEKLDDGDEPASASVGRYVWRSQAPLRRSIRVSTTRVERPHLLEGDATGELDGHRAAGASSSRTAVDGVVYEWNVRTTKRWMNLLAPFARPSSRGTTTG